jgi:hypothetical protein
MPVALSINVIWGLQEPPQKALSVSLGLPSTPVTLDVQKIHKYFCTLIPSQKCAKGKKKPICAPRFQSVSFKTNEVYIIWEPLKDSRLYPIEIESINAKH